MIFTYWFLIFLILYCYFLYPALLYLLARLFPHPVKKSPIEPAVSILISVCDEEDVIEAKIKNLLSLDYPGEKIEILIGSDGSKDKTNEIVRRFQEHRLILVESAQRRGKVAMISELVQKAKNDIIIFTDARQSFAPHAIRELVSNFADEAIGCVSGELIFSKEEGVTGKGINLYWNYEKFIRAQESRIHSMLGATGAIYAIRKELYRKPPSKIVLDDMFIPFQIVLQGYRAVFDPAALAYDKVADSPKEEYRRKTRTLFGNYQIFSIMPQMFNPFVSPVALQLFSHKFLRLLVPFFMIAVFVINLFLNNMEIYFGMLVLQVLFYAMAITGALLRYQSCGILKSISKLCYVPYVFCLLNFSALVGFFRFISDRQDVTWEKARSK